MSEFTDKELMQLIEATHPTEVPARFVRVLANELFQVRRKVERLQELLSRTVVARAGGARIVERLRMAIPAGDFADENGYALLREAADEIERLRIFNAVEIERLGQGDKRLREAVTRLLACPAIADENHSDPEWGCAETREAEAFARAALAGKEVKG